MAKALIAVLTVGSLGGGLAALHSRSASNLDHGLKTVALTRGVVIEKALAVGEIRPRREVTVKSKISGIAKRCFRQVGETVRNGGPLFEILPDPTPLERTETRRELEIARNVYDEARRRHERLRTLHHEGIVSAQDLEHVEKDVQDAAIRLNLASERLALVERGRVRSGTEQVESIIRAPLDGSVLERLVHEGDPVVPLTQYQAGTPLATLADMSALLFKGTVDEIDVGKLREGMSARIRVGALPEARIDGRVERIAPKSRSSEGTTVFDVEIALFPGPGVVLRAGYSANADIAVRGKEGVLVLPERLVRFAGGRATVEVPPPGAGEPVRKEVKVGLSDGMNVEIVEGLREKDLVVERPPSPIE
jgi:HlyD family secretion protein